jgi:LuxR family maltose regulon positive regulatory protein
VPDPGLVLKITPPKLRKTVVVRERLRQLRAHGGDFAVFQVEAPAGFGKTSLLAQWRLDWLQAGAAVAWLSLDAADTPITVVSGVVHGLRRSTGKPAFCNDALEAIRRGAGTEAAVTSLLAELAEAATPTVLIIDNCERIRDEAVLEMFDYLLHNLTPNLQLALGSRPPLPIRTGDLLAQASLCNITAADLRLDLAETIRLLTTRLGDRIDPDQCARLHEATEGWPLGLQLAATTLEQSADPARSVAAIAASGDDAMRRLFDGMLDALPRRVTDFLTRCSLVSPLHPSLCEEVTGEETAALLLQQLLVETPLLTAAEESDWFRLHPLAREYLQARADQQVPDEERKEIHRRAWHWLATHGYSERAAQQALAAGHRSEALNIIAGALNEEFNQGHAGVVASWLARIPPAEIGSNPILRVISVLMLAVGQQPREARAAASALAADSGLDAWIRQSAVVASAASWGLSDELAQAMEFLRQVRTEVASLRTTRAVANGEAYVAMHAGATERARQLIQSGNPDDGRTPVARMWGEVHSLLTYLWEGRPAFGVELARRQHAIWESRSGRRDPWVAMLGAILAAHCWMLDERDEARAQLAYRLDALELSGLPQPIGYAYRTAALIAASSGDDVRAFALLERLAALGAERSLPRLLVGSLAERIRLHVARRRSDEAAALLPQLDAVFVGRSICVKLEPVLRLEQALARAFVECAASDPQPAATALADALARARALNRGYEIAQVLALQAVVAERIGQPPAALLQQALSRAEAGGLVRAFADALPEVVELVRRIAGRAEMSPVSQGFVDRVLAAANVQPVVAEKPAPHAASAILTVKESEVLRLLAGGLPNKRIATELGLSSETVKWHVKKLFAKLNAGSRDHAVDRARMLGLLP